MSVIAALSGASSVLSATKDLISTVRASHGTDKKTQKPQTTQNTQSDFEQQLNALVSQYIGQRDADKDGKVNATEFGSDRALFDRLDVNRDGKLEAMELRRVFTQPIQGVTAAQPQSSTSA